MNNKGRRLENNKSSFEDENSLCLIHQKSSKRGEGGWILKERWHLADDILLEFQHVHFQSVTQIVYVETDVISNEEIRLSISRTENQTSHTGTNFLFLRPNTEIDQNLAKAPIF